MRSSQLTGNDSNIVTILEGVLDLQKYDFTDTSFDLLMQKRIHRVLVICSNYDNYMLEEDGRIDEQIFNEYVSLNLRYPPVFVQTDNSEDAFKILKDGNIDLIISMVSVKGTDVFALAKKIKKAKEIKGPAYIHVFSPCPTGWMRIPILLASGSDVEQHIGFVAVGGTPHRELVPGHGLDLHPQLVAPWIHGLAFHQSGQGRRVLDAPRLLHPGMEAAVELTADLVQGVEGFQPVVEQFGQRVGAQHHLAPLAGTHRGRPRDDVEEAGRHGG